MPLLEGICVAVVYEKFAVGLITFRVLLDQSLVRIYIEME